MKKVFFYIVFLALIFHAGITQAAKINMAIRGEYGVIDTEKDEPHRTTAIFGGWCRNVDIPASDSRTLMPLYQENKSDENGAPKAIGMLYYDDRGIEMVCLNEGFVNPFVATNVTGEMMSISGWIIPGKTRNIAERKVFMVDTMECLTGDFE